MTGVGPALFRPQPTQEPNIRPTTLTVSNWKKLEWLKFTTLVIYVKWRIKEIRKIVRSKSHYNENDNWLKGLLNYKTRVKAAQCDLGAPYLIIEILYLCKTSQTLYQQTLMKIQRKKVIWITSLGKIYFYIFVWERGKESERS